MQKIIMKLTKIFGIVLSLHVGVILLVMFQPSCQTVDKKNGPVDEATAPVEEASLNDFNQGTKDEIQPKEDIFVSPTRPEPGEIIVPGNEILVPQPLPIVEPLRPTPSDLPSTSLRPSDLSIYKVVRGDTLWGIARKNSISLSSLLSSNPNLSKSSRLSIGQEIMIPSGDSSSTLPQTLPVVPNAIGSGSSSGTYTVKPGDSLSRIARNNQVALSTLMEINGMNSRSVIRPGQILTLPGVSSGGSSVTAPVIVPAGATTHIVKKGENLTRIANVYGVSIKQIMQWNGLSDASKIRVGQSLVVSGSSTSSSGTSIIEEVQPTLTPRPAQEESAGDESLQDFFKGTTEDRPLIDAPDSP
jgi:LysM repeat protein